MAYTAVPTKATGDPAYTANDINTYIKANFASGVPDIFTTKGDIAVATAADTATRLGKGTNGYVLVTDSAQAAGIKWAIHPTKDLVTTKGDILAATASDTLARVGAGGNNSLLLASSAQTAGMVFSDSGGLSGLVEAKGNLIVGTADNTADNLAAGSAGSALIVDSSQTTGLAYSTSALINYTVDAKGDLLAGTADNTAARVPVSYNYSYLMADDSQTAGVRYGNSGAAIARPEFTLYWSVTPSYDTATFVESVDQAGLLSNDMYTPVYTGYYLINLFISTEIQNSIADINAYISFRVYDSTTSTDMGELLFINNMTGVADFEEFQLSSSGSTILYLTAAHEYQIQGFYNKSGLTLDDDGSTSSISIIRLGAIGTT